MNRLPKQIVYVAVVLLMSCKSTSQRSSISEDESTVGINNGLDPDEHKRALIRQELDSRENLLKNYFTLAAHNMGPSLPMEIQTMLRGGLFDDIDRSLVVKTPPCMEGTQRRPSSTHPQKGAEICVDLSLMIAEGFVDRPKVLGMLAHELAHHHGLDEAAATKVGVYIDTLAQANPEIEKYFWDLSGPVEFGSAKGLSLDYAVAGPIYLETKTKGDKPVATTVRILKYRPTDYSTEEVASYVSEYKSGVTRVKIAQDSLNLFNKIINIRVTHDVDAWLVSGDYRLPLNRVSSPREYYVVYGK